MEFTKRVFTIGKNGKSKQTESETLHLYGSLVNEAYVQAERETNSGARFVIFEYMQRPDLMVRREVRYGRTGPMQFHPRLATNQLPFRGPDQFAGMDMAQAMGETVRYNTALVLACGTDEAVESFKSDLMDNFDQDGTEARAWVVDLVREYNRNWPTSRKPSIYDDELQHFIVVDEIENRFPWKQVWV